MTCSILALSKPLYDVFYISSLLQEESYMTHAAADADA